MLHEKMLTEASCITCSRMLCKVAVHMHKTDSTTCACIHLMDDAHKPCMSAAAKGPTQKRPSQCKGFDNGASLLEHMQKLDMTSWSHSVHEKEATPIHAVTSQTYIKGICKSYRHRQGCGPLCSDTFVDTSAVSTLPNCMWSVHNMALPVPCPLKNSSTTALSAGSPSFS